MTRQSDTRYISQRLSLRKPQEESLALLDRFCDSLSLAKDADAAAQLQALKAANLVAADFEFERDFPSLCFALATGVGKTRLMGAFIAYLYRAQGKRHFFVLAPNLTIYNKLIADFTPGSPKYVFQGIDSFSIRQPRLITGDNYEEARGLDAGAAQGALFDSGEAMVNIFNISKINSEVRGGKEPRIKRLQEVLGTSYFEYLSGLPDLVLLMDESHRYRAEAGMRAINELKPILGLELTATPQVQKGSKQEPFRNVAYSYPLSEALKDGYVKEPAVATRENFDPKNYKDEAALERLKLEDGLRIHEVTQRRLEVYAKNTDQRLVKPFVLVVAQDTGHAEAIKALLEREDFLAGRYRGKTLTVHSNQTGAVSDEAVAQLLALESADNKIEVVIHVNKLGEGWDVTNLYTLIPLRAANSKTLVEQSIGRGLRLPYGRRTGVADVDRLTIVAHDKFQEIIDEANREDSLIKRGVVLGRDIPDTPESVVTALPVYESLAGLGGAGLAGEGTPAQTVFALAEERAAARAVLEALADFKHLPLARLQTPEVLDEIAKKAEAAAAPGQGTLEGTAPAVDYRVVAAQTVRLYLEHQIGVPRVMVMPKERQSSFFAPFEPDLEGFNIRRFPPVPHDILIQQLRTHARELLSADGQFFPEARLENYIIRALVNRDEVHDALDMPLLQSLAGKVIAKLRSEAGSEDALAAVMAFHGGEMAEQLFEQMLAHPAPSTAEWDWECSQGHQVLKPVAMANPEGSLRDFRAPVEGRAGIRSLVFGGFAKSLRDSVQFQSDPERRFAVILEDAPQVLRWSKPALDDIRIYWDHDARYVPDFIVETESDKWLCEVKAENEMDTDEVKRKAQAAVVWCRHASDYELTNAGKAWSYALIPCLQVTAQADFKTLVSRYQA